jgi:hypothetical protein
MWPHFLPHTVKGRCWLFGAVFAAIVLGFGAHACGRVWSGRTDDFAHFYRAAHGMLHGENIYTAGRGRYVYPAFLAFVLQPIALLSETGAATIWIFINVLLIFGVARVASVEIARRWLPTQSASDGSVAWALTAIAAVLAADKIHAVFAQGQSDFIMLIGFACALRWMERKPLLAGLAVGLTANIKYFSLIFVPYFLLKGRYRAAFSSLIAFAIILLLPAIELGLRQTAEYIAIAGGGLAHMTGAHLGTQRLLIPAITWEHSVSVTSALFRLTRSHAWPDSLAAGLAMLVLVATVTAICAIGIWHGMRLFALAPTVPSARSRATETLEWAMLIVIAIAFSPQATARHMLLSFLLYILGAALLFLEKGRTPRVLLIFTVAAMAGATSLPPPGMGLDWFLNVWRTIGGAGWCAILLILALVWVGGRTLCSNDPKSVNRVDNKV